jgi:HPr kinase/phosphorylase
MTISVADLVTGSIVLAGRAGLRRSVKTPQVIAPDLIAADFGIDASSSIMHILPSQASYLCTLPREERMRLVRAMVKQKPACILLSGGTVCKELLEKAEAAKIPVVKSRNLPSLRRRLVKKLSTQFSLHGVLVQIFGLGTLIIGESAVGKSEAALDLVLRGHRLVADDMVILLKTDEGIIGRSTEMGADLLQIRGLGIINMRALYGGSATAGSGKVDLVVELEEWKKGHQYSLVGLRERRYRVLGTNLPYLKLPVKLGRNMATLIEVAARNQMLKNRGIFIAREFNKKLRKKLVG